MSIQSPQFGGTGTSSYNTGDLQYASATNVLSNLPVGSTGQVLTVAGGIPSWATPTVTLTGDVTGSGAGSFATTLVATSNATLTSLSALTSAAALATVGTIGTGVWQGTKVAEPYGGTNQSTYTTGDILYASASNTLSKLPIGTAGQLLTVSAGKPAWAALVDTDNFANQALSNLTATAVNVNLVPDTNDNRDLGASGTEWNGLYVHSIFDTLGNRGTAGQVLTATGAVGGNKFTWLAIPDTDNFAVQDLSNLTSTNINQSLNPNADISFDLGNTSFKWNSLYARSIVDSAGNKGTAGQVLTANGNTTYTWASSGADTDSLSGLTAALASNTIDNLNFAQVWNWSTLASGNALNLSANSTSFSGHVLQLDTTGSSNSSQTLRINNAGTGNGQGINISMSGATGANSCMSANASSTSSNITNLDLGLVSASATGTNARFTHSGTSGDNLELRSNANGVRTQLKITNDGATGSGTNGVNGNGSAIIWINKDNANNNRTTSEIDGIITDVSNGAFKGALVFKTADNAGPAEVMRLDNKGRMTITSTQTGQADALTLTSAANTDIIIKNSGAGTTGMLIGNDGGATVDYQVSVNDTNGKLTLKSNGTANLVLQGGSSGTILANSVLNMNTHQINNVVDPTAAQDAATKSYVDAHDKIGKKELFVLSATNITNQYIDLSFVAETDSISFLVKGGGEQIEGASYDYTVNYTGGAGGNTRITFVNGLATGGVSALVAGNVIVIQYRH